MSSSLQPITFLSLALRILHGAQRFLAYLSLVFLLVAAVFPLHNAFLFALLFGWITSSFTTAFLVYNERAAATKGTLSQGYFLYQIFKIGAASVLYGLGFTIWCNTTYHPGEGKSLWMAELWDGRFGFSEMLSGELRIHATILWMHALNWIILWAAFIYSAFIPGAKEGQIKLENNVEAPADLERNEETARES